MKKTPVLLALLFGLVLAACDFTSSGSSRTVALGELVEIEEGKTVRIAQTGALLTFENVHGDSRCPIGLICVWAGMAETSFRITGRRETSQFSLVLMGGRQDPYEQNEPVVVDGYVITLLQLSPYPEADKERGRYTALLRVEAAE